MKTKNKHKKDAIGFQLMKLGPSNGSLKDNVGR